MEAARWGIVAALAVLGVAVIAWVTRAPDTEVGSVERAPQAPVAEPTPAAPPASAPAPSASTAQPGAVPPEIESQGEAAVQAFRESTLREAVKEAVYEDYVACAKQVGVADRSVETTLPVEIAGQGPVVDCAGQPPDLQGLCECLADGLETRTDLAIYAGMRVEYPLSIRMKD